MIGSFFDVEDGQPPDDECCRYGERVEEQGFDRRMKKQAEDGGGQETDQEERNEASRGGVTTEATGDVQQTLAVIPTDGKYGAELDNDLENLACIVRVVEQVADDNQVAGTGDRKKLGQPLDNAKHQGRKQNHEIHGQLSDKTGILTGTALDP